MYIVAKIKGIINQICGFETRIIIYIPKSIKQVWVNLVNHFPFKNGTNKNSGLNNKAL